MATRNKKNSSTKCNNDNALKRSGKIETDVTAEEWNMFLWGNKEGACELEDGMTMVELSKMLDMSRTSLRVKLRPLMEKGDVETGLKSIVKADGTRQRVAAYRIKPGALK